MTTWIASPTGTPDGDGSLDSPWDLGTAVSSEAVQPGDTVRPLAGTYRHPTRTAGTTGYKVSLQGDAEARITIRPAAGDRVIIDGGISSHATTPPQYVDIQGLEVYVSESANGRVSVNNGSTQPADLSDRPWGGVEFVAGTSIRLINLIAHNNMQGIGAWTGATGMYTYGCLCFDNGWLAPDQGHGHGVYTQNNTPAKEFRNNIFCQNFGHTFHAYGSGAASLNNFHLYANSMLSGTCLVGGESQSAGLLIDGNWFLKCTATIGYHETCVNSIVRNNRFGAGVYLYEHDGGLSCTGNKFYLRTGSSGLLYRRMVNVYPIPPVVVTDYEFGTNTYWLREDGGTQLIHVEGVADYTFAQWQSLGMDADGTFNNRQPNATDDETELVVNAFDDTKAKLTILNWSQADSVSVDLSDFATAGDYIRVRNVQDYFGDVRIVKYTGDPVAFDMRAASHSVSTPIGYTGPLTTTSFPTYGVFVLERLPVASGGWRGIIRKTLGWLVGEAHPPGAEWYYRHLQG